MYSVSNKSRFEFGQNWNKYSKLVSREMIESAKMDIIRLLGNVSNKTVLDIGCGSGIHTVAFLLLGVKSIISFDYDINSVNTTKQLINKFCKKNKNYTIFQGNILNQTTLINLDNKKFDIVYSWGVLHHTGFMNKAILASTNFVKSKGRLVLGLYVRTMFCKFWYYEKILFNKFKFLQPIIKFPFLLLLIASLSIKKRKYPSQIISKYQNKRGMSIFYDVNDWLGGFPYESINENDLLKYLCSKDFNVIKKFNTHKRIGVFGSGCGEWVFKKR